MTHDVERVFADIDADHGDRCVEFLRHGVLLVLSAPRQLLVLAGPEHGRTMPLADIPPSSDSCPWFDRLSKLRLASAGALGGDTRAWRYVRGRVPPRPWARWERGSAQRGAGGN